MSEGQKVKNTDPRAYFTMLPNLYDDAGLDVYEFRLLSHYVRRGSCFESVRTTAQVCEMSHPKVIEARNSLEAKGFIRTTRQPESTILIEVVDKWKENMAKYSSGSDIERGSMVERGGSTVESGGSVVELKKNHVKNTQVNKRPVSQSSEIANPVQPNKMMVFTLGKVLGTDLKISSNYSRLAKLAKDLIGAGYSPEVVLSAFDEGGAWYRDDWRGKKGERPKIGNIAETIGALSGRVVKTRTPEERMQDRVKELLGDN